MGRSAFVVGTKQKETDVICANKLIDWCQCLCHRHGRLMLRESLKQCSEVFLFVFMIIFGIMIT